jgi:hypothetical protein
MKLFWPIQVASIALDRDTKHDAGSGRRTRWILSAAGPFCMRNARTHTRACWHADQLAARLSNLLALPTRQWTTGAAISIQAELSEEEWMRIFRQEYKRQIRESA